MMPRDILQKISANSFVLNALRSTPRKPVFGRKNREGSAVTQVDTRERRTGTEN
jgi:hypothetical protein